MMLGGEMIGAGNGSVIDDNGYYQFVVSLLDESAAAAAASGDIGSQHSHSLALKREMESLGLNEDDCKFFFSLPFLA
jgi:hypothetical protein